MKILVQVKHIRIPIYCPNFLVYQPGLLKRVMAEAHLQMADDQIDRVAALLKDYVLHHRGQDLLWVDVIENKGDHVQVQIRL